MTEILVFDFVVVLLIFLRVAAMFFAAPVFGHNAIPPIVKMSLSILLAYIIFLTIDKSKISVNLNLAALVVYSLREIITGLIMGFVLNFVFWGVSFAGSLIGYDMGLMFAEVLNPFEENNNNVIGEVLFFTTVMIFILINGHHYIITGVAASFNAIPIAKYTVNEPLIRLLIKYSFAVFTIAVKIASPILVSFFLVHLAEGIIARVIPNIQIFYVSQPLKIGLGVVMMTSLIPFYVFAIKNLLQSYEYSLLEIVKSMGT
ncbi:MAG: flagellar biosynthetic protein FliR [Ignavibacteriales bacterium]|nr:flagellar biosynthetic protein FliR [Ignavibacteriales bacterium]